MAKKRSGPAGKAHIHAWHDVKRTRTIAAKGTATTKGASGAALAGKARARSSAVGKMSVSRLPGPTPGRRTISDEALREIVREVIGRRSAPVDA